jgi:hypothetical protein
MSDLIRDPEADNISVFRVQTDIQVKDNQTTMKVGSKCLTCGKFYWLKSRIDCSKWLEWEQGELIQSAFPDLSLVEREFLMTLTCEKCWNAMFPEDEE